MDGFKIHDHIDIDYSKGILWQLFKKDFSVEQYIGFINEPKHLVNPVRDLILFDTSFCEFFSKTPWYAIPTAWLPLAFYFVCQTQLSVLYTSLLILLGVVTWSLAEYLLHRFVFHGEEYWLFKNRFVFCFHFLAHGIHHAFPQDRYRLVFPLLLGYNLYKFGFLPLYNCLIPELLQPGIKCGTVLGYIAYDLSHYFIHHSSPRKGYFKSLKLYHMQHHYRNGMAGYGVSSKFWDIVFNTELDMSEKVK